jgi:DNA-binding NtrC family response regulator
VRVLAATNRNPFDLVAQGSFREDLLYRLNVITIDLPPLRERKEDIPLLAQHLVTQLAAKHHRPAPILTSAAIDVLSSHSWPGNVRELRNALERALIICAGDELDRHHFAPTFVDQRSKPRGTDTVSFSIGTPLEDIERVMIMRTLRKTDNNKTRAADLLKISLKTLHNKLKVYRDRGLISDDEDQYPQFVRSLRTEVE